MKSFISALLYFLLSGLLHAQQWQPLTSQEHFHYQADTAHYISHVMVVDSVTLDGTDSVFHLNRVTAPCDTCVYYAGAILINQPQFLLRTATRRSGGLWEFRDGNEGFVLHTQALAGAKWPYRLNGGPDTALVVSADTATTFGTADSVKRIAVGTDTILLSKHFGLLHFPAIDDSLAYTLTGIDHGRTVGVNLPGLAEYYDFAPGDAFYFSYGWGQFEPAGWGYTKKRTILSKSVLGDTLVYTYSAPTIYGIDTADMKIYEGNSESGYPFSSNSQSVRIPLPNAFIQHDVYPMYFGLQGNYGTVLKVHQRPDGVISLSSGQGWDDNNLYFQWNDTTLFLPIQGPLAIPEEISYQLYMATGRGLLLQQISLFESGAAFTTLGYIKNGVTYGTVPEDSVLIGVNQTVSPTFTLSPNPAHTHLALTLTGDARSGTATLSDLQGREVLSAALSGGTARLETSELPAGMYLLRVQTATGAATQKVVIQH